MIHSPSGDKVLFLSKSLADTAQCAQKIVASFNPSSTNSSATPAATILALSGDLGSGKTAFVKALASALGIKETITSPTFVIEQIYVLPNNSFFDRLIHIDAYRLEKASELERLGWAEIATNPRNLICFEWPENVAGLSHFSSARRLQFRFIDENTREISFE
jgi:tRNA threonylcarbamoyladenosine biosynthesis protein TsaE